MVRDTLDEEMKELHLCIIQEVESFDSNYQSTLLRHQTIKVSVSLVSVEQAGGKTSGLEYDLNVVGSLHKHKDNIPI